MYTSTCSPAFENCNILQNMACSRAMELLLDAPGLTPEGNATMPEAVLGARLPNWTMRHASQHILQCLHAIEVEAWPALGN